MEYIEFTVRVAVRGDKIKTVYVADIQNIRTNRGAQGIPVHCIGSVLQELVYEYINHARIRI